MVAPKVIIIKEHGTNCEEESKFAFEKAGADADIMHMEDLIRNKKKIFDYQILMFPGGFSYGDDLGSGMAWANRIRNNLSDELIEFVNLDKLVLGICSGFQLITNLGLVPGLNNCKFNNNNVLDNNHNDELNNAANEKNRTIFYPQAALMHNKNARYIDRWVDLKFMGKSPLILRIDEISLPIAHGEGLFYAEQNILGAINAKGLVSAKYVKGNICNHQNIEHNPNGSLEDIAGICDESGKILGMMPHPERALFFTQRPDWPLIKEQCKRNGKKIPICGEGLKIFENGVWYFK